MLKTVIALLAPCVLGANYAAAQDVAAGYPQALEMMEGASPAGAAADAAVPSLADLKAEDVNDATFEEGSEGLEGAQPLALRTQILLDRADVSPGVIDAFWGENVTKALSAYQKGKGLRESGRLDEATFSSLANADAGPVLVSYEITAEDVSGQFGVLPTDYAELAKLKSLHYASPLEMFGERFHMDTDLLAALNHSSKFGAGETILVADVGKAAEGERIVTKIRADKRTGQLIAYDSDGNMVTAYPATIGSDSAPSPAGDHKVSGIAVDPVYYYDPKNFKQGNNTEKLELPAGPNSPVGSVWIDLTEPTYGIHGTPEPSKIDKSYSHGCVRLTNWDAEELARLVKIGAVVSFVD
jgi:lipoprotein-anchoring transpeptidase ErfK/SrfK